jgi:rubrerythrin
MCATSLIDAIRVVKENEWLALTSYAASADKVSNPVCIKLFKELSEFERYHFERLTALEKSLDETGEYIDYEGREFPLPPILEIKIANEPQQKSVLEIFVGAMDLEKAAARAYAELAAMIEDEKGNAMFARLAKEEHNHFRVLAEAYDHVNTLGTMKWVAHDPNWDK